VTWSAAVKKAIVYRLVATLLTGSIVWLLTGTLAIAGAVALLDGAFKTLGYTVFERVWARFDT